jgi:hypothetical protein
LRPIEIWVLAGKIRNFTHKKALIINEIGLFFVMGKIGILLFLGT